jgi:hypothetical protein
MCSGLDLLVWLLLYSPSPRHMLCYALGYQKYIIFVKNFKTIFTYIVQAWAHKNENRFFCLIKNVFKPSKSFASGFYFNLFFLLHFFTKYFSLFLSIFVNRYGIILLLPLLIFAVFWFRTGIQCVGALARGNAYTYSYRPH